MIESKEFVTVVLDTPANSLAPIYDYALQKGEVTVLRGMRVLVPFGNSGDMLGIVVGTNVVPSIDVSKIKYVKEVLDKTPVLTEELIEIGYELSKRTISSIGRMLFTMIPQALKIEQTRTYTVKDEESLHQLPFDLQLIFGETSVQTEEQLLKLKANLSVLRECVRNGLLNVEVTPKNKGVIAYTTKVKIKDEQAARAFIQSADKRIIKQKNVLEQLLQGDWEQKKLLQHLGIGVSVLRTLIQKGLIERYEVERYRELAASYIENTKPKNLTAEQKIVLDKLVSQLSSGSKQTSLLHGVT
ncbi:MAG: hypothetical protein ACRCWQ_08860, partial [Bacilli bacterium]